MQIKLEVCSAETIKFQAKGTRAAGEFEVFNCREASPASLMAPVRLSARDYPGVKAGAIVVLNVSEISSRQGSAFVNVRGSLVQKFA
jgi:hypothetical protein